MVRTLEPSNVVDDFVAHIRDAKARSDLEYHAIPGNAADRLTRQRGLVSDFAFRLGGEWELFQHRWHIAVISKAPATFVASLQAKLDTAVAELPGHGIVPGLNSFHPEYPTRLPSDTIESLLDSSGYNITFRSIADWKSATARDFTRPYSSRVARIANTPEDACVLELVKAVRNFIAHGSTQSRATLNACIATRPTLTQGPGLVGASNAGLARGNIKRVRDVGVYLRGSADQGMPRRVTVLTNRLEAIAATLR
ncbi:hypothetical protein ACTHAM_001869 [Cellulomonas soli]|uniref:hypothetical protein n=1 Tax=Cellulomonas soli TaxID=931535 RepID=UPI003F836822